jgi:general L-amino acid transport system substrate-binding protein
MKRVSLLFTFAAAAAAFSAQAASAETLKTVQDRGTLSCGVSQGLPGFSAPDDKGRRVPGDPSGDLQRSD